MNKVKDMSLVEEGLKELDWAEKNMPVLKAIGHRFEKEKPLNGLKVSVALHLEKKTGQLIRTLCKGGATVRVASCNPLTTDDRVAAALTTFDGIEVFAWANQNTEDYYENLNSVIENAKDRLGGKDSTGDIKVASGMKAEDIWKMLADINNVERFLEQFNILAPEIRHAVAEHVLTKCNVFSGKASVFSARYNDSTGYLE